MEIEKSALVEELNKEDKSMGEMEQAFVEKKDVGHKVIETAIHNFGRLGYQIKSIDFEDDLLNIKCYCPQVNKSSRSLSMDGISESFKD
jgi:hypothetical protein